eukprot:Skav215076  [mRNA]  locus=scaffold2575:91874:92299:- [translate_table: standard]
MTSMLRRFLSRTPSTTASTQVIGFSFVQVLSDDLLDSLDSSCKSLQSLKFAQVEPGKIDPKEVCAICLDGFETEATPRKLPCGHLFHASCLQELCDCRDRSGGLPRSVSCPMCRRTFPRCGPRSDADAEHRSVQPVFKMSL